MSYEGIADFDDERHLVECLRDLCTPYGDERKSELRRSADILLKYGRLYARKSMSSTGTDQKLNFIKCAALLNACKSRCEMFHDNTKNCEAVSAIQDVNRMLVRACNGTGFEEIAVTANNVKRRFKELRLRELQDLERLGNIGDDIADQVARDAQESKILTVKRLIEKNTANFKALMCYIANKCIEILGENPCQFSILGLGSLARGEITLYSDFENVIILEDGVENHQNYPDILEYFRWFAVLFQIIIIGLGETMLPSVGIETLNNFYSEDKRKNWFFDAYTPSGVAIDGMMPQACKTPFGRPYGTPNKPHTVELIQPVRKMASFLSSEEDLKNGYNLKDVLRQSCFVFGCDVVHNDFARHSRDILRYYKERHVWSEVRRLVAENINDMVKGLPRIQLGNFDIDTKSLMYRPLATLFSYVAHAREMNGNSSGFEILSKLAPGQNVSLRHRLSWAFAVSCELRMKVYGVGGGSRHRVVREDIHKFVGKSCLHNCIQMCLRLSTILASADASWEEILKSPNYSENGVADAGAEAHTLLCNHGKAIECYEKSFMLLESRKKLGEYEELQFVQCCGALGTAYYELHKQTQSHNERREMLKKAKRYILWNGDKYLKDPIGAGTLVNVYFKENNFKAALNTCEQLIERHKAKKLKSLPVIKRLMVHSLQNTRSPSRVISYCEEALLKYDDVASNLAFKFGIAVAKFQVTGTEEVLSEYVEFLTSEGSKQGDKNTILQYLSRIIVLQHQIASSAVLKSWKYFEMIMESKVQFVPDQKIDMLNHPIFAKTRDWMKQRLRERTDLISSVDEEKLKYVKSAMWDPLNIPTE